MPNETMATSRCVCRPCRCEWDVWMFVNMQMRPRRMYHTTLCESQIRKQTPTHLLLLPSTTHTHSITVRSRRRTHTSTSPPSTMCNKSAICVLTSSSRLHTEYLWIDCIFPFFLCSAHLLTRSFHFHVWCMATAKNVTPPAKSHSSQQQQWASAC